MGEFDGLKALVTGAASGMGYRCCEVLLERGASVAGLDMRVEGMPPGVHAVQADITDDAQVDAAVAEAVERLGGLDVLLNVAGVGGKPGSVEAVDLEDMAWIMDVNVYGIVRVTRAALPALRQSSNAAIVNVASLAGIIGYRNRVAYGATKGAVVAMTRMMAADLAREGIRVNATCPGSTETPWVASTLGAAPDPAAAQRFMEGMIPVGRLATSDEQAQAICFLASPNATYFHGAVVAVDGGISGLWVPQG